MAIHAGSDADLGEKLKADGSAHPNRIRMYGEQFDLTSNPTQKKTLFAIEAIPRKSGRETAADSVGMAKRISRRTPPSGPVACDTVLVNRAAF
jgi:hypothetical protein